MAKNGKPKTKNAPKGDQVKVASDPEYYLGQKPVWRFSDFDWDGPWGLLPCQEKIENLRSHIEQHLANFESMTWSEIQKAAGGRAQGNNSHHLERDKLNKKANDRLDSKGIKADTIFSLRLDAGTRIYGVREGNCLRIAFFDPYHKEKEKCAYDFKD